MKPFKYIALSLGVVAFSLTSCSGFLDKIPDERTDIESDDVSDERIVQLLTTAYPSGNYGWVCELSSDNMMDNNSDHLPSSPSSEQIVSHYNLAPYDKMDNEIFAFEPVKSSSGSDSPYSIWQSFYSSIATVNHALRAIDRKTGGDDSKLSQSLRASKAEALLIRAYCHFVLVNVFSQAYKDDETSKGDVGVPYVTEPEEKVSVHYDRSNVTETYQKIQADLEWGLANIADVNYTVPKWHFNVNAAHAFAARFYLFKRQYDKVIEHANNVLGTDEAASLNMMMKYDNFDDCSYSDDFANVWQSPSANNNLMLMDTYSIIFRHAYGARRYANNSMAAREIYYHNSPLWKNWVINPTAIVCGLFGSSDYGYINSKICERFEYSDKISGIGYAHTIRREFTGSLLMLERAEAKIMKGDYAGGFQDLVTYDKSLVSYSEAGLKSYFTNNRMTVLNEEILTKWFSKKQENPKNYNCFDDWNFTQNMSASFIVPQEAVPYMNCLNYFRRFETQWDGYRFFDLKRWGIEYSHVIGPDNVEYTLKWNDPRRAIELPQEVIAAGLEPSQKEKSAKAADFKKSDLEIKTTK